MIRKHIYAAIYMLCLIFLGGCNKSLGPVEFSRHINNIPELKSQVKNNQFVLEAEFKPSEYMALLEFSPDNITSKKFDEIVKQYENSTHFTVKFFASDKASEMLRHNLQGDESYYDRIHYLSTDISSDFSLIQGEDTTPCSLHIYERAYSIRPFQQVVLVFETEVGDSEDFELIYNGRLSNYDMLRFPYSHKVIQKIPKLKIT